MSCIDGTMTTGRRFASPRKKQNKDRAKTHRLKRRLPCSPCDEVSLFRIQSKALLWKTRVGKDNNRVNADDGDLEKTSLVVVLHVSLLVHQLERAGYSKFHSTSSDDVCFLSQLIFMLYHLMLPNTYKYKHEYCSFIPHHDGTPQ